MPINQNAATKRLLRFLLGPLAGSLLIYIGLTYLVPATPAGPNPSGPAFKIGLTVLGVVAALASAVAESVLLQRAKSVKEIPTALIVSAALSEASGVFALMLFFVLHERFWLLFAISGICFLRIAMRLPEYDSRIDALS